ncbi:MAG: hypothetical protein ACF8R9_14265 [Phycisphaerales bacterium JB054]
MRSLKRLVCTVLALCGTVASAQTDSPYVRVVDADESTVRLDVAVRTLVPNDPAAPIVHLVGAVHIADAPFYTAVQSFLDVHDIVLYEGVGGAREPAADADAGEQAAASTLTARRLVFLAMLSDAVVTDGGDRPRTLDDLGNAFGGAVRSLVSAASRDGWGHDIQLSDDGFDAVSLGADAEVGGTGLDADLRGRVLLDNPPTIVPDPDAGGMQRDLADALGLTFQLDGIDYSLPHWRNSDLSIAEIQEALGGPPASAARSPRGEGSARPASKDERSETAQAADALFQTLSGESFLAKISGFLIKTVGASPQGRALVKVMLAETLSQAEALLGAQPGAIGDLMKVIIEDRNVAVVDDLRALISDEPEVRTVAIFYGAGHFGDLEARINEELGYTYEGSLWIPAMTIDLEKAGLSASQVGMYRTMMRRMLESQLKAVKKN